VPDVPVIVTFAAPVAAELDAVKVITAVPVAGFGVSEAVTPLGRPDTLNVTLPLKPYSSLTKT
jgi:hypothetical protein